MNILQIRSEFGDHGPGTQAIEIGRALRRRGHTAVFASGEGLLDPEIKAEGFQHYTVATLAIDRRDPLSTFRNVIALARIIRRHRIDAVHGHNAASTLCAFLGGLFSGRRPPVIAQSVHGIELRENYGWRNWIYRIHPGWLFAVSDFTSTQLVRMGVSPSRVITTWNGVDMDVFDPSRVTGTAIRAEFGIPNDAVLIGHVGAFSGCKGQQVLVQAVAALREQGLNCYAIMVGDGPDRPLVEDTAVQHDVTEWVRFAGFRRDIPEFQAAFDIYTQPSTKGEMLPIAIIEGMAMGNPWVGSDLSGLSELAEDGQAGLVSPPGNVVAYTDHLAQLIRDPARRNTMGQQARDAVKRQFTIDAVLDRFEPLYHQRPTRATLSSRDHRGAGPKPQAGPNGAG